MTAYKWRHNASTGSDLADIPGTSQRLVRTESKPGYLYSAEEWGDYSPDYPVKGPWESSPRKATEALGTALRERREAVFRKPTEPTRDRIPVFSGPGFPYETSK